MKNEINTFSDLLLICGQKNKRAYELVQEKEAFLLDTSIDEIRLKVKKSLDAMKNAIKIGLKSDEKSISKQCGDDCKKLQEGFKAHPALFGDLFEKITTYALATIEENLRMGKIVACPTAGSCAIVPAVLIAISEKFNISEDEQINALITAGLIGSIVQTKVSLAGAVAGCQAECGVASAMSAGALVQILGGKEKQIVHSAALALKNILGLTCDPVAGLVEIPCVKRNAFLAVHAVTAAELALAGIESKIPPDEVIDALTQTGQLMSPLLKECSQAGLAKTKTALKIEQKIFNR
ncbi:MAG: L-serine ammonia-lyase, iron-sulfur-dependent, subunit alpha [Candidatus Gastranaerophilales bacterium]|nr:L-serine ammonia-lyase, iron-sulfur-dependent, subunit alpha [Candidatus Gastranaerophilales bacterium]